MSLSNNAVRELQRELAHLEQARVNLNTRIDAIHALVGETKSGPGLSLQPLKSSTRSNGSNKKRPFQVAVLQTVTTTPGLKPRQVTDALMKSGYSTRRKAGFKARVYNTMYDMFRKGVLKKNSDGGYVVDSSQSSVTSSGAASERKLVASADVTSSPVPAS